jgi:hypothetical protein
MYAKPEFRPPEEAGQSSRERMVSVLDALSYGLWPVDNCPACRDSLAGTCTECAQALADIKTVQAGTGAVRAAGTEEQARAAYRACLLGLIRTAAAHDSAFGAGGLYLSAGPRRHQGAAGLPPLRSRWPRAVLAAVPCAARAALEQPDEADQAEQHARADQRAREYELR